MLIILKSVYLNWKIYSTNKGIIALTNARSKIKAKQAKLTASCEKTKLQLSNLTK